MDWSKGSDRIMADAHTCAERGVVRWAPTKSLWIGAMTAVAVFAGPLTFARDAVLVFVGLSAVTLCVGHSVGMHRRLIHNSFECPRWLEYIMVYSGVLVGMAGPFGLMKQHDLRDWAQRQPRCHDFLKHGRSIAVDYWWQLHCDLHLERPPKFVPEPRIANDAVYLWMERTWMWHQLPLAILLYALGGWSWVVWGVAVRVVACVGGHWLVGFFAHNEGPMRWRIRGAGVQGHDVPLAALLSMGESWHNNHHAYPGSARIGLNDDQPDPGWWFILALKRLGLAWDIKTPSTMPARAALERVSNDDGGCPVCRFALRLWRRLARQAGVRPFSIEAAR
jgi:fatty-acid desaturase